MTPALLPTLLAVCVTLPVLVSCSPPPGDPPTMARVDTLAAALYSGGIPFAQFLDEAERRRDTWLANYERADAPASLVERARVAGSGLRLLVVAEDWCGDSAHTIPYLARFVESVEGLELRVIDSKVGQDVMNQHPTPDGRGSTPTVVVLDAADRDVGCWVERPSGLQSWWLTNPDELSDRDKLDRKYGWYDADAGYHTVLEIVETLEAAARGEYRCAVPVDPAAGWPAAGVGAGG